MTLPSPKIDPRGEPDLVAQTEALARRFTAGLPDPWRPRADQPDAGRALARIFGRMTGQVIERLNRLPEKHFLAFLNLIGAEPLPPQPARAPLTFSLATGGTTDARVPARTPVSAPPAEDEREEVIFETERELVVTPAQLTAVFVYEPATNRFGEATALALGRETGSFPAFAGDRTIGDNDPRPEAADGRPALYLGFDRPFSNRLMTLYVQVEPPSSNVVVRSLTPARVHWEYAGSTGWRSLGAADETQAFAQSGLVQFIGPADFSARAEFGQSRHWLRARWEEGEFNSPPRLRRLLPNTTWASQGVTLSNEILGSSTGEPRQTFRAAQSPILLDPVPHLQVREPAMPPAAERTLLEAEEGRDAIVRQPGADGRSEEIWVRWHRVADFHGSGPRDRHYVLDSLTGELRFGDGRNGMAPPPGRGNLRLARYRVGGGRHGNRPADTIAQLKTTIPYVAAVTHEEAAGGGADRESLERVKERGPKALRHRGRAVTVADYADLAIEVSPQVARARAIAPRFDPIDLPWLPNFRFRPDQPGRIDMEARWPGAQPLAVELLGPGQGLPYARAQGSSPLLVTHTVAPEQFIAGDTWRVILTNPNPAAVTDVALTLRYPVGTLDRTLDLPATTPLADAGQVELVLVPQDPVSRPRPSPALIRRVQDALRARHGPDSTLRVTEPDWLEVTVTAEVVPGSLALADPVRTAVATALERFLHPLSGGTDGRGWPFGRRPYKSDLYALLEAVESVDHVRTLTVSFAGEEGARPDRFLIFSGQHVIRVGV